MPRPVQKLHSEADFQSISSIRASAILITPHVGNNAAKHHLTLSRIRHPKNRADRNSYDRNGNRLASNDSVFGYDQGTLLPVSETLPIGSTNITRTLVRSRDALLRDTGFTLWSGSTAELASAWTYDAAGRPETVTGTSLGASAAQSFTYGWQDGRPDLLARVDGPAHTVVNTWEPLRAVLAAKSNRRTDSAGGAVISGYTYAVNSLGQRVSVQQSGSAFTGKLGYGHGNLVVEVGSIYARGSNLNDSTHTISRNGAGFVRLLQKF